MTTIAWTREFLSGRSDGASLRATAAAGCAGLLCVLGLASIWPTLMALWAMWTTDALKSIGMVVPVISFVLVLRVWRQLGWEQEGSWWGFAVLLVTAVAVRMRAQSVLELVVTPQWTVYLPPHSLVMFCYGVGATLLFGGWRLVRAARFPLVLLFAVNPVPHTFNVYVDLPLQRASAHVARAFAMALGQPLTPDKLRLMFTPDFGMFIAPGCNGIRGAVTMGLIALVTAYVYRFRWRGMALVVAAAVLLGYVFNFARLCVLVLFYLVALKVPRLRGSAENADYVIGGVLFFIGVYLLYGVIQRFGSRGGEAAAENPDLKREMWGTHALKGYTARLGAMALLAGLGTLSVAQVLRAPGPSAELLRDETALGQFPEKVGSFVLARRWNETLVGGALLFHWAEYAPMAGGRQGAGSHVMLGISPVLGSHDTLVCHSARGEDPIWHGAEVLRTRDEPVSFSVSLFNDGAVQYLETTTLCNGSSCGEYANSRNHLGLVYSKPHPMTLLSQNAERPIPILLKAETVDTTLPVGAARAQLLGTVADFLSEVKLGELTQVYRR